MKVLYSPHKSCFLCFPLNSWRLLVVFVWKRSWVYCCTCLNRQKWCGICVWLSVHLSRIATTLYLTLFLKLVKFNKSSFQGICDIFPIEFRFLAHLSSAQDELSWSLFVRRPCVCALVRPSVNIFKRLLLWSRWANFAQISYGASLGWGNEKLLKWSRSVDQDGRHAHIW